MADLRRSQRIVDLLGAQVAALAGQLSSLAHPLPGGHCSNCGATEAATVLVHHDKATVTHLCDRCALYVTKALDAYQAATGYRPTGGTVDERA